MKQLSYEISVKRGVTIKHMETDKDHIHCIIETDPTIKLSNFVRTIKSYTAFHIWQRHKEILRKHFWKEHTFLARWILYLLCW
ncbi:MAG: IS200/IS605 family transposase [Clostridiales bacterium]|nr:IS200/IS605 family transposase [Clostridiales bacterium]